MKQSTVDWWIDRLKDNCERIIAGKYHELDIFYICNKIDWLWKWKLITDEQLTELTDLAIEALKY